MTNKGQTVLVTKHPRCLCPQSVSSSCLKQTILEANRSVMHRGEGYGHYLEYHEVPKFSDTKKLCYNLPKIHIKRPNHRVFCQNDANGIANSEDPDQTAPLGAV